MRAHALCAHILLHHIDIVSRLMILSSNSLPTADIVSIEYIRHLPLFFRYAGDI